MIKEKKELVHSDSEHLGKDKVSEFVDEYERRKSKYNLKCLYEYYHFIKSPAILSVSSLVLNMSSMSGDAMNGPSFMHLSTMSVMS